MIHGDNIKLAQKMLFRPITRYTELPTNLLCHEEESAVIPNPTMQGKTRPLFPLIKGDSRPKASQERWTLNVLNIEHGWHNLIQWIGYAAH